jgi:hypothetical protein
VNVRRVFIWCFPIEWFGTPRFDGVERAEVKLRVRETKNM